MSEHIIFSQLPRLLRRLPATLNQSAAVPPLPVLDLATITGVVAVWALGLRFAWRAHLCERFLGLDLRLADLPASPQT
jgi:hypothetical protein